jgi:HSP20 family molecular chaperone IbpA
MKRAAKSAAKLLVLENSDPISAETEAIQSRIRERAFERSLSRPHDAGELYDWIAAESEIISVPPVELIEKNGTFEVRFAIAGLNPDDVNVMVTADQILLKSDYRHEHSAGEGTVHLCDFKSTTVFRSVNLPQPIDVKTVKIDVKEGMLRVTAAAKQNAQPAPDASPRLRAAPARKAPAKKTRGKLA